MHDLGLLGDALVDRHTPLLGAGRAQHLAGHRARTPQQLPRSPHARAASGELQEKLRMVEAAIRVGELHLDCLRVNLQLLGDQHRMGGHCALSHLNPVEREDDGVVGLNDEPRVGSELTSGLRGVADCPLSSIATHDRGDVEAQDQRATTEGGGAEELTSGPPPFGAHD